MLNPIIYSFTVKEFKRSAYRAVLPIWRCVHSWCPRVVSKPPDAKTVHRIGRKRQQISATQQQQRVPPLSTMCCNATGPSAMASAMGADGRKRRIPSRERLSHARTGAIASLMVNTNCSIMQNAMTVELVNKKRTTAGGPGVRKNAVDNDDQKVEDDEKMSKNDDEPNRPKIVMANGGAALGKRDSGTSRRQTTGTGGDQPKRSMVMLGENLNKMAQRFARRHSSLDEQDTARKHSADSGGSELFSRSGLVTTTLLLATSRSMCDEEQLHRQYTHQHYGDNSWWWTTLNNDKNQNESQKSDYHDEADGKNGSKNAKRSASTTGGGGEQRTGSLPTSSPSFSSSVDSDLTAEHSQYSVRMPCKLPVKKWKRENQRQKQQQQQQRRRHSMHGIPSKSNAEIKMTTQGADEWAKHSGGCNKVGKKNGGRKCADGGGGQQQRRKAPLLFGAFKRMKATAEGDGNANNYCRIQQQEELCADIPITQNVGGLWQRARAMASSRRRHLIGGLSGSNSLGSIGGRKNNDKGRKRKERSAAKEEGDNGGVTSTRDCTRRREQQRERGIITTTTPKADTEIVGKETADAGESRGQRKRVRENRRSGSSTTDRRAEEEEVREELCQQRGKGSRARRKSEDSSNRLLEKEKDSEAENGREKEGETVRIFCMTDETPL